MKKIIKSILLSLFVTLLAAGVVYAAFSWSRDYIVDVNEPIRVNSATNYDLGSMYVGETKTIEIVVQNLSSVDHFVDVTTNSTTNLVVNVTSGRKVPAGTIEVKTVEVKAIDGSGVVGNTVTVNVNREVVNTRE